MFLTLSDNNIVCKRLSQLLSASQFLHLCTRTLQYQSSLREKRCWKSTITVIRNHPEISWPFYVNWRWQKRMFSSFLYVSFVTCQLLLFLEFRILCTLVGRYLTCKCNYLGKYVNDNEFNFKLFGFFLGKQSYETRRF